MSGVLRLIVILNRTCEAGDAASGHVHRLAMGHPGPAMAPSMTPAGTFKGSPSIAVMALTTLTGAGGGLRCSTARGGLRTCSSASPGAATAWLAERPPGAPPPPPSRQRAPGATVCAPFPQRETRPLAPCSPGGPGELARRRRWRCPAGHTAPLPGCHPHDPAGGRRAGRQCPPAARSAPGRSRQEPSRGAGPRHGQQGNRARTAAVDRTTRAPAWITCQGEHLVLVGIRTSEDSGAPPCTTRTGPRPGTSQGQCPPRKERPIPPSRLAMVYQTTKPPFISQGYLSDAVKSPGEGIHPEDMSDRLEHRTGAF